MSDISGFVSVTDLTEGGDVGSDFGAFDDTLGAIDEEVSRLAQEAGIDPPHGFNRNPFVFTRKSDTSRMIFASLNPTEVNVDIRLREQLEKCGGGEVKHVFVASPSREEELGRFIDEISFRFTLTTGNTLPVRISGGQVGIPRQLNVIYELFDLILNAERILPDGRSNDITVVMNTVQFPSLVIEGKVDPGGISYVQSAQEPTQISGISFTVSAHKTIPRLTDADALLLTWQEEATAGRISNKAL